LLPSLRPAKLLFSRRRIPRGRLLRQTFQCRGVNCWAEARPADLQIQFPRNRQHCVSQRFSIQAAPCLPTCHAASQRARTALAFRSAQEQVLRAAIAALDEALRDGGEQMTPALTT